MDYMNIDYVDKPLSRVVFGTATPAMLEGQDAGRLLDTVYKAGINTFDAARVYGLAERSLGDWIKSRKIRDKVVILTKGAHPKPGSKEARVTPEAIEEDLQESLSLLRTDYVDVYLLHRDDKKKKVGPLVEKLNELADRGKIRAFGGSNWTMERVDMVNEYAYAHDLQGFTVSSPSYGLGEQVQDPWGGGCVSISGKKNEGIREWYQDKGIAVFAYACLAHGFFSGKFRSNDSKRASQVLDEFALKGYSCPENVERLRRVEKLAEAKGLTVPQLALSWVLNQPLKPFAICSASKPERMLDNLKALEITLSPAELGYLDLEE